VSEDFQEAHPEIPWRLMVGTRNRIIHEYSRVNWGTIWDTVKNDLPTLVRSLDPLIPPDEET
jgi:uncharacterized protein with HEPN domain